MWHLFLFMAFFCKNQSKENPWQRVLFNRGLGMSPSCYQHAVLYLNFIHMAPKCAKTKPWIWPRFLMNICGSLPFVPLEASVDLLTPDTLILCVPHFVPGHIQAHWPRFTSRPDSLLIRGSLDWSDGDTKGWGGVVEEGTPRLKRLSVCPFPHCAIKSSH